MMKRGLHRFGKFYSKVIINYIGIFIFIGILSVVFGEHGWLPNKNIYAISQFGYKAIIPILIAYAGGSQVGMTQKSEDTTQVGGVIAVMAISGMVIADEGIGILSAMIFGPICGILWKRVLEPLTARTKNGLEMLTRNITAAITGCVIALFGFYFIAPIISGVVNVLLIGVNCLIQHKVIWLIGIVVEPLKVFFLNNSINHGIFIPLGLQQAEQTGESLLFLLETNPGPGVGLLIALYTMRKEKREKYAASIFAEFIGGIHEIYFPEVISNLWLMLALIAGGLAGNLCFMVLHAATTGVVSPGSIITIILVSTPDRMLAVLTGVGVSMIVSAGMAICILKWQENRMPSVPEEKIEDNLTDLEKEESVSENIMIRKIGVVCNAGVGSSAMGAALFRRKLKEHNLTEIEVGAYAADQLPEDLDIIICQKDLKELLLPELNGTNIYVVESLLSQEEYETIIEKIQKERDSI